MAKPNKRHHELCEKYKNSGQREKNKEIKQARHQRRLAKIAERRTRKETEAEKKPSNGGSNKTPSLKDFAYRPRMDHKVPYARFQSFMRCMMNQIYAAEAEEKKKMMEDKKRE